MENFITVGNFSLTIKISGFLCIIFSLHGFEKHISEGKLVCQKVVLDYLLVMHMMLLNFLKYNFPKFCSPETNFSSFGSL